MSKPYRICIVGSGNWGSTIAKIVGLSVQSQNEFHSEVMMWVHEELVDGRKLTEIINHEHENIKYLPGIRLPCNVIATADLELAAKDADILVFVIPHQFLKNLCQQLKPVVQPNAYGVSLMKGLALGGGNEIQLLTDVIREQLSIRCAVLMGANLASEVAQEAFCESTIGATDEAIGLQLKRLFQTDYFRIVISRDEVGVELCGALKNVVAVAAGVIEGLGYGDNTKAAVVRLGFTEMKSFMFIFFGNRKLDDRTFFESCGIADLITSCYGGRNKTIGIALADGKKSLSVLETELLNGQSAQGPHTAAKVYVMLKARELLDRFPVFSAVHKICAGELPPFEFLDSLQNHPQHD